MMQKISVLKLLVKDLDGFDHVKRDNIANNAGNLCLIGHWYYK